MIDSLLSHILETEITSMFHSTYFYMQLEESSQIQFSEKKGILTPWWTYCEIFLASNITLYSEIGIIYIHPFTPLKKIYPSSSIYIMKNREESYFSCWYILLFPVSYIWNNHNSWKENFEKKRQISLRISSFSF